MFVGKYCNWIAFVCYACSVRDYMRSTARDTKILNENSPLVNHFAHSLSHVLIAFLSSDLLFGENTGRGWRRKKKEPNINISRG